MPKLNHIIYDWLPEEGKDTAMSSALERYETKREEKSPGGYDRIARELSLLATDNDAGTAATLKAEAKRGGFFWRKPKKALAKVADDAVVVIIAHGSDKKMAVGYVANKKPHMISAQALAEMLELDGLPKGHKFVKLNSCYAAGGHGVTLDETFAQQLAKDLGRIGYNAILVGGYENKLRTPSDPNEKKQSAYTDNGQVLTEGSKDVATNAAGGRTWYDNAGKKIFAGKLSDIPSKSRSRDA